jgi:MFS family permease
MFFQGAGANLWQIGREIAVINLIKPDQRGRAMSAFFGVGQFGNVLGPLLGGVLTDLWGFRALFLCYAAIGVVVTLISLSYHEEGERKPHTGSFFDFGRLSDLDPLFRATFLVLIWATFCMMLRMTVYSSMLPLYAGTELGYSATKIGSLFGLVGIVNLVMIVPAGYISDKFGRKAATVPAASCIALSFLVIALADSLPMLYLGAFIHGIGSGFASGSMTTSTFDIAPEGGVARFQSLRRFAAELGSLSGPPVAGAVAGLLSPREVFFAFIAPYAISALLLAFVARETHPSRRRKLAVPVAKAASTP